MNLHIPVLINQILAMMSVSSFSEAGLYVVDACFGEGGYTDRFLSFDDRIKIIGIEQDRDIFDRAVLKYKDNPRVKLFNTNFIHFPEVFEILGINFVHFFVYDLGLSMVHYKESKKGLSFFSEQPLDMRLSNYAKISAEEIINTKSEKELADIFYNYADESFSYKIAKNIVQARQKKRIKTTKELRDIIVRSKPYRGRIDPATKVFQALRIVVNNEYDNLKTALLLSIRHTIINGRIFVVSYHSGEDRIVKHLFRDKAGEELRIVTKKPIAPLWDEVKSNHSSRSAKLRVVEKIEHM